MTMNQWWKFFGRIFRFPVRLITQPRLLLYFVFFIVLFGGLGTWISWGQWLANRHSDILNVYHNFATYLIAIAVTAFADYLMVKRDEDNRTLTLFLFALVLISGIASVLTLVMRAGETVKSCAIIGGVITWILWLIVNADNENLTEDDALSAIGGTIPKPQDKIHA